MAMDRNIKRVVIGGSLGAIALALGYGIWRRRHMLQLGPGGEHEHARHGEHGHHEKHKHHHDEGNERGEYGEKRHKHHHHKEHEHGE